MGLAATTLAGCGMLDEKPAPAAAPDALQPLLDEALALAAAYDRATAARPALSARLTPLAADHRAHAADLTRLIGASAPAPAVAASGSVESSPADPVAALRAAEQAAQQTALAACLAAPADRAGLIGSIAACRATHAEALR